jgi:hypothetical protein
MRVWVDFPEEMGAPLDGLARARGVAREELIRKAVSEFLVKNHSFDACFGLWAGRGEDGVAYQERLRSEWE